MKPFVTRFLIRFIVNSSILSFEHFGSTREVSKTSFQKKLNITQFWTFSIKTKNVIFGFFEEIGQRFSVRKSMISNQNRMIFGRNITFLIKNNPIWRILESLTLLALFLAESKFSLFSKIFYQKWNSQRICIIILV